MDMGCHCIPHFCVSQEHEAEKSAAASFILKDENSKEMLDSPIPASTRADNHPQNEGNGSISTPLQAAGYKQERGEKVTGKQGGGIEIEGVLNQMRLDNQARAAKMQKAETKVSAQVKTEPVPDAKSSSRGEIRSKIKREAGQAYPENFRGSSKRSWV